MERQMAEALLQRLDVVERRLEVLLSDGPREGLTAPEPTTGEQWDDGQVWAHISEFPEYWLGQVRLVLAAAAGSNPLFGRDESDSVRLDGIAQRRHMDPQVLFVEYTRPSLAAVRELLVGATPTMLTRRCRHIEDGVMSVSQIIQDYIVGHLEEHVEQLSTLPIGAEGKNNDR